MAKTKTEETTTQKSASLTAKEAQLAELDENLKRFQKRIKTDIWGHDKLGMVAIRAAAQMNRTTTGRYARIPIYCKGDNCPYAQSCALLMEGLAPEGQACPTEIALIQQKVMAYAKEFDLDLTNDTMTADKALVEEIILMEINMERCKALMSSEVSPVQMMVAGMADDGTPIMQPQVSKSVEAYERFSKKRNADYDLLLATRKNKQKDKKEEAAKQDDWFTIIENAQANPDFYNIEKRPDNLKNISDAKYTEE